MPGSASGSKQRGRALADVDERMRILAELEATARAVRDEEPEEAAACVRVVAPMIERWRARAVAREMSRRSAPRLADRPPWGAGR